MSSEKGQVSIVVDPNYGDKLRQLAERGPAWVCDSAANRRAAETLWADNKLPSGRVTTFQATGASAEAAFLSILDTVVQHHPDWRCLDVVGCSLTAEIRSALADYGGGVIGETSSGFLFCGSADQDGPIVDLVLKFAKYDRKLLTGAVMEEKQSRILQRLAEQHGGVLNRADLALKIGELFAANVYDEDTMAEQRPFDIRDDGDRWIVYGSHNREMKPGDGPLKVVLRKWDGAVLDIAVPMIYTIVDQQPSPEELARPREERFKDWLDEKPGQGGFGGARFSPPQER